VCTLLKRAELNAGSNPMSEVAAAFHAAMWSSREHSVTQDEIATAAKLSTVTIRNNCRKFMEYAK
jgi:transcription initiation factor TFIIIB Brf1 subunit/transcription initiation factor TFIIB